MARPKSLTAMSVDALLKMRDNITAALRQKAGVLKKELSRMGADYAEVGRCDLRQEISAGGAEGRTQISQSEGRDVGRPWRSASVAARGN